MVSRNLLLCLCAGALLVAASAVPAQGIYKQVDSAGRVVYTDRPDSSRGAELIVAAAAPAQQPEPLQQSLEQPPAATAAVPVLRPNNKRRYAAIDAREAERRLQQARLNRDQGATPLPGEQARGTHSAAPNERYWRRQEQLRREVEAALRRVQETHQVLLAAR